MHFYCIIMFITVNYFTESIFNLQLISYYFRTNHILLYVQQPVKLLQEDGLKLFFKPV